MQLQIIGEIRKGLSDETGIHKGLKNPWEQSHTGSSPVSATTFSDKLNKQKKSV